MPTTLENAVLICDIVAGEATIDHLAQCVRNGKRRRRRRRQCGESEQDTRPSPQRIAQMDERL